MLFCELLSNFSLVEFVDWLWHLCIHNIHPAANFQRLDTCFRLIDVILGTFERRPHQSQRKGGIPGADLCYCVIGFYCNHSSYVLIEWCLYGETVAECSFDFCFLLMTKIVILMKVVLNHSAEFSCDLMDSLVDMCLDDSTQHMWTSWPLISVILVNTMIVVAPPLQLP